MRATANVTADHQLSNVGNLPDMRELVHFSRLFDRNHPILDMNATNSNAEAIYAAGRRSR